MRGSVRKRGSTWEYRLELGLQPKQRCRKCREEYWPDGRPLAACPCGGQLEDVQRRRERTRGGFRTKKLAQEALDKAKVAVQEGEYVEPSKLTVADYLVRMWLPSIKASLRPSTYQSYRMQIETYILPRLGSIWLQKLGPEAIGALYADLLDDGKVHRAKPVPKASGGEIATTSEPVKRGLSPVSVRHTHAVGRRAFRDAVKRQYLKRNPFDAVDQPKAVTVHEMKFWNAEQVRTFLAATRGERLNPLWRLLVDRGLRRGEACGLRWEDVDFETSRLSIRRALIPLGREVHICEPKTKKGRRVLPLNAATVAALREPGRLPGRRRAAVGRRLERLRLCVHAGGRPAAPSHASQQGLCRRPEEGSRAAHPAARSAPHLRRPAPQGGRPYQGRPGTARPRDHRDHDGHLLPCPARHAGRGRRAHRRAA